jgi:hypothetical protein
VGWREGEPTDIHYSAVDIAKFFQSKQPRAMSGVIEGKGLARCQLMIEENHLDFTDCGCIDGHGSCVGGWIRFLADVVSIQWDKLAVKLTIPSMKLQRLEFLDIIRLLGGTHFQMVEERLASSLSMRNNCSRTPDETQQEDQISAEEESRAQK